MNNCGKLEIFIGIAIVFVVASIFFSVTRKLIGTETVTYVVSPGAVDHSENRAASFSDPEPSSEIATFRLDDFSEEAIYPDELVLKNDAIPVEHLDPPQQLVEPSFSASSGSYFKSQFPINLQITNSNDPSTWVMVSINRGEFREFGGGVLQAYPDDFVEAYVRGDSEKWIESGRVSLLCKLKPPPGRVIRVPLRRLRVDRRR